MYFHISNRDSTNIYPENRPDNFNVFLLKNYVFPGVWECGLISIIMENKFSGTPPHTISICVDICDDSFIKGMSKQILQRIPVADKDTQFIQFTRPCYTKVIKRDFNSLCVTVLDENLKFSTLTGDINLTLHVRKVKNG